MKSLNTAGLLSILDLWFQVSRRLQGGALMRGDFLPPFAMVPVGTRSSSHRESRKSSPSAKYKVVLASSSSFPPVRSTGLGHPLPKSWDTETLTGSNCGVTPCSCSPSEKDWRGQVWDRDRSAASCRAGKQKHCQGGLSSTLNCVESLPCNFGIIQCYIKLELVCCLSW